MDGERSEESAAHVKCEFVRSIRRAMWRESHGGDNYQLLRLARSFVIGRFKYAMLLVVMTTSSAFVTRPIQKVEIGRLPGGSLRSSLRLGP
jgi:hypothetical protein